jgi:hypothetical protein
VSFRITARGHSYSELINIAAGVNNTRHMILHRIPMALSQLSALHDNPTTETRALVGNEIVGYAPGDMVPWHFVPSIIVASFFASFSGTLLTIELLQRKRLGKSLTSRQAPSSAHISDMADLVPGYIFWLVP